ncbi:uncharacterized protein LOC121245000 [Juglans microcarpa x Juglans regia]|uniref:uncharacterized protein LOC121245000 n=1 Tax=Juglans microcarpa x Juglans regia TaxID=2249226 RepID=UPI001B7EA8FD|nr:uncharacterized protein LOC121245000 [Juglans microcarpa x Juglans regia]
MEIPVINRLSSMQNPSLLSRVLSVSGFEASSFWKLGALILAIVASFGTLVNGIKVFIVKIKRVNSIASEPLLKFVVDDYTDSEDETCSLSSSYLDDEEEDSDDDDDEPKLHRYQPMDDDFRVAGGSGRYVESHGENPKPKLRRGFSWADLTGGRSVVKLWDKLGSGLDFDDDGTAGDESYSSVFSVYQTNRDQRIVSLWGGTPAAASKSAPVIVAARRTSGSGDVSLGVWDSRLRRRIPAIFAEWRPQLGKIVGIGCGGVEKVYVRDDASADLTVGDMRNVSSPLTNVTASDMDSWWDADDAVFVEDEQPRGESN